jgi:hypothetical protein
MWKTIDDINLYDGQDRGEDLGLTTFLDMLFYSWGCSSWLDEEATYITYDGRIVRVWLEQINWT